MERTTVKWMENETEFMELYERYAAQALRFAASITYSSELAADAVQEAFLRIYRNGDKFRTDAKFEPWFFRIVANESKRQLKKNKHTLPLDEELSAPDLYGNFELSTAVKQALFHLEPKHREIIALKYLSGYDEKQISAVIGRPVGTVKSRLFAAREKLREILKEQGWNQ